MDQLLTILKSCCCPNPHAVLGDICKYCGRPYITQRTFPGHKTWNPVTGDFNTPKQYLGVNMTWEWVILILGIAFLVLIGFVTYIQRGKDATE